MKAKDWDKIPSIERKMSRNLQALTRAVKDIVKTYNSVEQIIKALNAIGNDPNWKAIAEAEARAMVYNVANKNAKSWREAAKNNRKAGKIYEALKTELDNAPRFQQLIRSNAIYISNIPLDIGEAITAKVSKLTIEGLRAESITMAIKAEAPQLTKNRINLIARTETAKTQATITQIRAEQIGANWYVWQTSRDQRVRSSHHHMQGVVCNFASPPSPEQLAGEDRVYGYYNAGNIFNCRCYAAPIIDLDFETFPISVVYNNKIVRMTRKQFEAIQ